MDIQFHYEKVTEHIFRILGFGNVCMYFVAGSKKGLLIDTGYGVGDLKGYLKQSFSVDYDVLLTHGHYDHVGGIYQWESVYLNALDLELCVNSDEERNKAIARSLNQSNENINVNLPVYTGTFVDIKEGMIFDLGDECVEIIHVPGHTRGSIALLVNKDRTIILGDACGEFTFLYKPESSSVKQYLDSLEKIKANSYKFDRILRQHGSFESPVSLIDENIDVAKEILEGKDDRIEWYIHGQKVYIAKKMSKETHSRSDGKRGNIVYSLEKID